MLLPRVYPRWLTWVEHGLSWQNHGAFSPKQGIYRNLKKLQVNRQNARSQILIKNSLEKSRALGEFHHITMNPVYNMPDTSWIKSMDLESAVSKFASSCGRIYLSLILIETKANNGALTPSHDVLSVLTYSNVYTCCMQLVIYM